MKKLISLILVLIMIVTALAACNKGGTNDPTSVPTDPDTAGNPTDSTGKPTDGASKPTEGSDKPTDSTVQQPEEDDGFKPIARFVVTSDIHISSIADRNYNRTESMIKQMNEYAKTGADGYDKLDAILVAGDLTNNGTISEYNAAKDVFNKNLLSETKLVAAMGNHDWNNFGGSSVAQFEGVFGSGTTLTDTVINGYHFITIIADSNNGWEYSLEFSNQVDDMIQNAVSDTGRAKPVFVIQHIGNVDTAVGTCTPADNKADTASTMLEFVQKKYDNLVVFSGHTHFPANDECSIWQEDFTSINTGTLNYAMRSMVNNQWIDMPDRTNIAQSFLVEIDAEDRMKVRCWDVQKGEFVGETWLIESWDKDDFVYTADRFSEEDIFFSDEAEITVTNTFTNSVAISFPPVPKESLSGRVYEIKALDAAGREVSVSYKGVEYFNEDFDTPVAVSVGGLSPKTKYTIEVRAVNSLYTAEITSRGTLYSQPLSVEVTTLEPADIDGADIIDVKIDTTGVTNSAPGALNPNVVGSANISYDSSIDKNVISFNGTSSGVVKFDTHQAFFTSLQDSMTFEAYFKIDARPTDRYFSIISAQQGGGFGIDVYNTTTDFRSNQCQFHFNDGLGAYDGYKSLGFEYDIGVYYHLVAVFDGSTYTLYVDGEKIGSMAVNSPLKLPDAAKYIYMGGDTDGAGSCQMPSKCTVAGFRLYSYALSEAEAQEAYAEMTGN